MTEEDIQKRVDARRNLGEIIAQREKDPENPDLEAAHKAAEAAFRSAHKDR